MLLDAIFLVAAVALLAVAVHFGPHGSIVSGIIGAGLGILMATVLSNSKAASSLVETVAWSAVAVFAIVFVLGIVSLKKAKELTAVTPRSSNTSYSPIDLINEMGVTVTDLTPSGTVKIHGDLWSAETESMEKVERGTPVFVSRVEGLKLIVIPQAGEN
jgi:membrane-bound serine protease (ClpP class)